MLCAAPTMPPQDDEIIVVFDVVLAGVRNDLP